MSIFGNLLTSLQNLSNGTQVGDITTNQMDNAEYKSGNAREIVKDIYSKNNTTQLDNDGKEIKGTSSSSSFSLTGISPVKAGELKTNASSKLIEADYKGGNLLFSVPNWGYKDYIYERTSWQKGFDSITRDPGWFYFKIFFKFGSGNGLLSRGGYDSAYNYLQTIKRDHKIGAGQVSFLEDKLVSLEKFITTLSYINSKAPWFFKEVNNLNEAFLIDDFTKPMSGDRHIELVLREDAVDTRITTLFELYKYACFDYINMKEVVPENLRQFEMIIVLFHTPIRWYHTGMQTMRRGTFEYKNLYDDDADNRMTYKMFTFQGCEFDLSSLKSIYPSNMSNETGFKLSENAAINIKYKRVYQHTFNEFGRFMIGDDGVHVNAAPGTMTMRQKAISDAYENPYYYNPGAEIYKAMVDASEAKITDAMRMIDPQSVFGNLYYYDTDPRGPYFKEKMRKLKQGSPELHKPDRGR